MGINPGELGTHSFRNVTETMVPYGCIVSPTTAFLCIRCGWSMGIFKEIYLKYEASGDHYIGRCASSLYQNQFFFILTTYLWFFFSCKVIGREW